MVPRKFFVPCAMRRGLFARVMSQARVPAPASDEYRDSEAKPNGGDEPEEKVS